MRALISWAVYFLPSISVVQLVPIWRLTERMVRSGLVIAWRLATSPTSTSPAFEKPTTDGVVRDPSALGMTVGSPASSTETTELVVPRSIPTALGMEIPPKRTSCRKPECDYIKSAQAAAIPGLRPVFGQAAGGGQGQGHEVPGGAAAEGTGQAPALAEALDAVAAHQPAPHQRRHRVPRVGRHLGGGGVVAGDHQHVGAQVPDRRHGGVERLDGRHLASKVA